MKKKYTSLAVAILAILTYLYTNFLVPLDQDGVHLAACVDGDTARFVVDGKEEKVRFLAIDTPEITNKQNPEPFGIEASEFTCRTLSNANTITLEYETNKRDKYNRLLAWVFVDDKLLQEALVENGYAKVAYLYGDYKYTNRLQVAQLDAQAKKLNIFSK